MFSSRTGECFIPSEVKRRNVSPAAWDRRDWTSRLNAKLSIFGPIHEVQYTKKHFRWYVCVCLTLVDGRPLVAACLLMMSFACPVFNLISQQMTEVSLWLPALPHQTLHRICSSDGSGFTELNMWSATAGIFYR